MATGQGNYIRLDDNTVDAEQPQTSINSQVFLQSTAGGIRWDHIQNLDEFFSNVYHYHQHGGFKVIFMEKVFNLLKFIFIVFFTVEMTQCIRYEVIFSTNETKHWSDIITRPDECWSKLHPVLLFVIVFCAFFFLVQIVLTLYRLLKFWEIRAFYISALNIRDTELSDMTWYDVQSRLLEVQKELQICVHKAELDEVDIYNRILRHKNYLIAMVNNNILPIKIKFPILGEYVFLSEAYLYNLEIILFWGPFSPFKNYWHLRDEYKHMTKRLELAKELSNQIMLFGLLNLLLSPVIILVQILVFICEYAERLKSHPGHFLGRRWSNYGRLYLRHFNELNHEFQGRTSLAYNSATTYLNSFTDKGLIVIAKNVAFITGAICIVMFALTVMRESVTHIPAFLGIMLFCGSVARNCWNLIPDESTVWCPETLLLKTLGHIHYMPDHWTGHGHTKKVRNEFAQLFQYRLVKVMEELLSPLVTPILLIFYLPQHSLEIVDFLRNFTVEVAGVGDICSFAQMDIHKHGHPMWMPDDQQVSDSSENGRMENGKTELSLMHFHLTNPRWRPSDSNLAYLKGVREKAVADLGGGGVTGGFPGAAVHHTLDGSLIGSGNMCASMMLPHASLGTLYTSLLTGNNGAVIGGLGPHHTSSPLGYGMPLKGNVSRMTGPAYVQTEEDNYGVMGAMSESMRSSGYQHPSLIAGVATPASASGGNSLLANSTSIGYQPYASQIEDGTRELLSINMSASALYMHELHQRRKRMQSMHRSHCVPGGRLLEPIEQEPDAFPAEGEPPSALPYKC